MDIVHELAEWLRAYGRANVLEDNAPDTAYKGKDYTVVYGWAHGSPYGASRVDMGFEARNIQLRERRVTREAAYEACDEVRNAWKRGVNENVVQLASGNVTVHPTNTVAVMQRDASGVVCYCEFTVICPTKAKE